MDITSYQGLEESLPGRSNNQFIMSSVSNLRICEAATCKYFFNR